MTVHVLPLQRRPTKAGKAPHFKGRMRKEENLYKKAHGWPTKIGTASATIKLFFTDWLCSPSLFFIQHLR